jgi:hypothetical protein
MQFSQDGIAGRSFESQNDIFRSLGVYKDVVRVVMNIHDNIALKAYCQAGHARSGPRIITGVEECLASDE